MALLASDVITDVQVHLNDTGAVTYTSSVILPYLKIAVRDLQSKLLVHSVQILREVSAVQDIPANQTTVNAGTLTDLLIPIKIEERADGDDNGDWIPLEKKTYPLDRVATTTLIDWDFRENAIEFIGATVAREIRVTYQKLFTPVTSSSTPIDLQQAHNYLGYRTAYLIASTLMMNQELANALEGPMVQSGEEVVSISVKGEQQKPIKRKGAFRSTRRRR